jgi:hypothetical protein
MPAPITTTSNARIVMERSVSRATPGFARTLGTPRLPTVKGAKGSKNRSMPMGGRQTIPSVYPSAGVARLREGSSMLAPNINKRYENLITERSGNRN